MLKRCLLLVMLLAAGGSAQLPQVLPANRPHVRDWPALVGRDPVLARGLEAMRQKVRWPRPLPVRFADTGKVNAWYQPGDHSVTLDYSLLDFLYKTFDNDGRYRPQAETLALRAGRFILLHELGHALIIEQARVAAEARLRFPLNLGDCFAYALAKVERQAILTLDSDFRCLDVAVVIPP